MNGREKIVYEAIKSKNEPRGVNYMICYYTNYPDNSLVSAAMEKEEFNTLANLLVAKGKLNKFQSLAGEPLYTIREEIEDKISSGRGELFSKIEKKLAEADAQVIIDSAFNCVQDFIEQSGMTNEKIIISILIAAARIGLCGKNKLSDNEKRLADDVFSTLYNGPMNNIYGLLCSGCSDDDFGMIQHFCDTAVQIHISHVAIHLLQIILSFAYIDGKLTDKAGERIEGIFGMVLMDHFFKQDDTDWTSDSSITAAQIDVVAREILKTGITQVSRQDFEAACRRCGVNPDNFTQDDLDALEDRLNA